MNAIFEKKSYFQLTGRIVRGLHGYLPMFHPHAELLHITQGQANVTVDGVAYSLKAGDTVLIFPYLPHSYEESPDVQAILLLFDPSVTVFDNTLLMKKPVCCRVEECVAPALMERAITMLHAGKRKTAISYLNAALGELLEFLELEERESPSGDVAVQLLSYCEAHFGEDITVQQLADALYISPSYVSKIFSQKLKTGFRTYINDLRIHKAQTLLKETDQKILQIMETCGFQNQSSFNRVFREHCGMSPRQYRRINQNQDPES